MKRAINFKFVIILVFVAVFFVAMNLAGLSDNVKGFFYSLFSPAQKALWAGGANVSDFFSGVFNSQNLKKENDELKLKLAEGLAKNVRIFELEKENETLRSALQIGLEKDFQLAFADVIEKDVAGDFILLDKGTANGIEKNMPVITAQRVLAGRVFEVYDRYCRVMLLSDKNSVFDAKVSGKEVFGVAKGLGTFNLSLELVPREAVISEGDLIVTAALGGVFPHDILVGEISRVKKSDVEAFQTAEIKSYFDPGLTDNLFIILDI